jgi:hypothetical protein
MNLQVRDKLGELRVLEIVEGLAERMKRRSAEMRIVRAGDDVG